MRILVCDPSFYQINYEINPWMNVSSKACPNKAYLQWNSLVNELRSLDVEILSMPPKEGLPDMVFTANAGVLIGDQVVLSNFSHKERQGEKAFFKNWFIENGYKTAEVSSGIRFEGAGDCLVNEGFVFMGYGFRSDVEAYYGILWESFDQRQFTLRLSNPYFYHLDTCFCPLKRNQILIYPDAFEKSDLAALKKNFELFCVPKEDAYNFACNAVVVDDHVVLPKGCSQTVDMLTHNYYIPHEVEMSEFIKAGGACKCLTLLVG